MPQKFQHCDVGQRESRDWTPRSDRWQAAKAPTRGALGERNALASLLGELGPIGIGRQLADAGIVARLVVASPFLEGGARMDQRGAQYFVQELVSQPSLNLSYEGVLYRLARVDVVPVELAVGSPRQDGVAGQPSAVAHCERAR